MHQSFRFQQRIQIERYCLRLPGRMSTAIYIPIPAPRRLSSWLTDSSCCSRRRSRNCPLNCAIWQALYTNPAPVRGRGDQLVADSESALLGICAMRRIRCGRLAHLHLFHRQSIFASCKSVPRSMRHWLLKLVRSRRTNRVIGGSRVFRMGARLHGFRPAT